MSTDDQDKQPPEPRGDSAAEPVRLEYFAAHEPRRRAARGTRLFLVILLLSVAPFACGVVNLLAVTRSYSGPVILAHQYSGMALMVLGIVAAMASLVGFALLRYWAGVLAAALVVIWQLAIGVCIALG